MIRMVRSLMKIWLVTYMACGCVACRSNKKSHPLEGEVAVSVPCLRDMGIVRPIAGWSRGDSNMTRFKYRDGRIVGGYSTEYGTFIVETHPLAFRVFKEKKSVATGRVREVCFKPVRVAPEAMWFIWNSTAWSKRRQTVEKPVLLGERYRLLTTPRDI